MSFQLFEIIKSKNYILIIKIFYQITFLQNNLLNKN